MRGHDTRFMIGQNVISTCLVSENAVYVDSALGIAFPRRQLYCLGEYP